VIRDLSWHVIASVCGRQATGQMFSERKIARIVIEMTLYELAADESGNASGISRSRRVNDKRWLSSAPLTGRHRINALRLYRDRNKKLDL
jgi:hypothetical protein